jgi:histidinol-phosphate aminotransferase
VSDFQRDNVRRMTGYTWGEQPRDGRTIKLNTNENPFGPSPAVADALAAVDVADLRRYPPPFADDFRRAAAALHGVDPEAIIATNGGDELLRLVITTFVPPGRAIATTDPSYSLYPVLAAVQDCPVEAVPLGDDFTLPAELAARANAAGAAATFVVNPHAPTGALFTAEALAELAEALDGLLLIDEAYVDFVDPERAHDTLRLVRERDDVLLLRTLSKGYSLAGLRFGYGIGAPSLITPMLTKTRDSYNMDLIAQRLATAAITDREWAAANHRAVRAERARLADALAGLGFDVAPSQTNFLLARVPAGADAADLLATLKAHGILVRHFAQPGLDDHLRISVGTPEEDDLLLDALGERL